MPGHWNHSSVLVLLSSFRTPDKIKPFIIIWANDHKMSVEIFLLRGRDAVRRSTKTNANECTTQQKRSAQKDRCKCVGCVKWKIFCTIIQMRSWCSCLLALFIYCAWCCSFYFVGKWNRIFCYLLRSRELIWVDVWTLRLCSYIFRR